MRLVENIVLSIRLDVGKASWLATLCFLVWDSFSGKHITLAFGDIVFVQRYSLESLVCGQQNVQHFWLML